MCETFTVSPRAPAEVAAPYLQWDAPRAARRVRLVQRDGEAFYAVEWCRALVTLVPAPHPDTPYFREECARAALRASVRFGRVCHLPSRAADLPTPRWFPRP